MFPVTKPAYLKNPRAARLQTTAAASSARFWAARSSSRPAAQLKAEKASRIAAPRQPAHRMNTRLNTASTALRPRGGSR